MATPSEILLTHEDHTKLQLLLASTSRIPGRSAPHDLERELARALIVNRSEIPPEVVTLESRVEYEDLKSGEVAEYVITLPERANIEEGRISVLAPIGTALIGYRVGDVVQWSTPGGTRELKVRRVTRDPADHAALALSAARFPSFAD